MHKPVFILIAVIFLTANLIAQNSEVSITNAGSASGTSFVRSTNSSILGDTYADSINYNDVSGSPFWDKKWNQALLIAAQNHTYLINQARLNLYTGKIHFINPGGAELVADNTVNRMVIYDNDDTTKVKAIFEKFSFSDASTNNNFYLVLNEGETKLLKLTTLQLDTRLDVMAGKKTSKFIEKSSYYIAVNDVAKSLKKLNKENIFEYISSTPAIEGWLKTSKNQLKNEAQVISFLNYYNSVIRHTI